MALILLVKVQSLVQKKWGERNVRFNGRGEILFSLYPIIGNSYVNIHAHKYKYTTQHKSVYKFAAAYEPKYDLRSI